MPVCSDAADAQLCSDGSLGTATAAPSQQDWDTKKLVWMTTEARQTSRLLYQILLRHVSVLLWLLIR